MDSIRTVPVDTVLCLVSKISRHSVNSDEDLP
jgi:hypothetical protein